MTDTAMYLIWKDAKLPSLNSHLRCAWGPSSCLTSNSHWLAYALANTYI
jgi:hypothetical protein